MSETVLLDDRPYRATSLSALLPRNAASGSPGLIDAVLCNIIEDVNVPISAMVTFDEPDFLTVCQQNTVMVPNAVWQAGGEAGA